MFCAKTILIRCGKVQLSPLNSFTLCNISKKRRSLYGDGKSFFFFFLSLIELCVSNSPHEKKVVPTFWPTLVHNEAGPTGDRHQNALQWHKIPVVAH